MAMHGWTASGVLLAACVAGVSGGLAAEGINLARLEGVLALADSEHRDRWGLDGYQAGRAHDGLTDGAGEGARTRAWASDNWEVTHSLVLVFPRRVAVSAVRLHWARPGTAFLTPLRFAVEGLREGGWERLAEVTRQAPEASTQVPVAGVALAALRITQPPEGAAAEADRRLWIAEVEVHGTPVAPPVAVDTASLATRLVTELRARRQQEDDALVAPALELALRPRKTRGLMAIVRPEDVERGRRNVATHRWAADLAARIRQDADWWAARPDEYVHSLIPAGNPRAICPQFEKGCPLHGGARNTFTATLEKPYRWRCSKGGEEWHDGAVITHPKTGEQITVHDDGTGWLAPEGFPNAGRRYFFVAAYRYFLLGKLFATPYEGDGGSEYRGGTPVLQLALAHALTGEAKYAHTCAVMLTRLAELYPTYDGCIEGPSQRQDGYIGQTFERSLVQNLVLAADLIWDTLGNDAELTRFFAAKDSSAAADIPGHVQRNLLGRIYEYLHRLMPYMDGDFLMYEMTALAALAHCLGNPEIAAETLESDLGLRVLLTNSWFRDGKYIYDSCGYNVGNAHTPLLIGEWLHGFSAPPRYAQALDLYNDPEYRLSMLYDFLRRIDCDGRVPQVGDGGGSRSKQLRLTPAYSGDDEKALLRLPGEREFYSARLAAAGRGDPQRARQGQADWWLLFHADDALTPSPGAAAAPVPQPSHLFEDGGIAVLRAGAEAATRQHVCLTFSKGSYGHGHTDKLAINVIRYGYDLSADLGYPTTWTDLKYGGWETHTASHCTVMLDEVAQRGNVTGSLRLFASGPDADVVEADAERAYPSATLYRRTLALVRDEGGEALYTVDVFRAAGATTRDYLFHSLGRPDDLTIALDDAGAVWTRQEQGSLAGETIEPMTQGGYGFLSAVERARSDGALVATWSPSAGTSQPDRYLLTRRRFGDLVAEFTITRTGKASGDRERALFTFQVDPDNVENRRVAWLSAGASLPIGKAVRVRIEVKGTQATVALDGVPTDRGVDSVGMPPALGAIGFLHYYNYAFEYRDLVITPADGEPLRLDVGRRLDPEVWCRSDPTYEATGECLRVSDAEPVSLRLRLAGAPGREVLRAQAEGYGLRGQSPLEGHLIVRERPADRATPSVFCAVIEAALGSLRVRRLERLEPQGGGDPGLAVLRVVSEPAPGRTRVDTVFSAGTEIGHAEFAGDTGRLSFRGRFGLVASEDGKVTAMMLVGAGHLACGEQRLDLPAAVRGHVVDLVPGQPELLLRLAPGSASPEGRAGQTVLIRRPEYLCPATYTLLGVTVAGPDTWRLRLSMPFVLARGVIREVNRAQGSFATRTPVMKLRVNPGLFDGKPVAFAGQPGLVRLRTASEEAFVPAESAALAEVAPGGEYTVYDVGPGDELELVPMAWLRP
jgi:hypothetical protein